MNGPLTPPYKEILTPKSIHGAIPAVVTPLTEDHQLDVQGIHRLSDFLIRDGVAALFVLGTTGESDFIPADLKLKVIEAYVKASDGRVPVLAGISEPTLDETFSLAQEAMKVGVDAIVVKPLYLQGDPLENLQQLLSLVQGFPIMLYNIPGSHSGEFKGKSMPVEVLQQAMGHSNFMGIKDSSNDLPTSLSYIEACRPRTEEGVGVWQGFPNLGLESLKASAIGLVQSLANIEAGLFVNLCKLMQAGNHESAQTQQQAIDALFDAYPFNPQHIPSIKSRLVEMRLIASSNMFPQRS